MEMARPFVFLANNNGSDCSIKNRYGTQAYGLTAVLAGFLVGFKQLVPEHLVTLWGAFSIRVKVRVKAF